MSRYQRLGGELFWICFGQSMIVLGGIFGVRLLTYKLSPAIYGDLAVGMTAVIVAQQIILGPLGQGFLRFFASAREEGRLNVYINTIRLLLKKATVLIIIIALISVISLFSTGHTRWVLLFSLAFLYSISSGYNIVLNHIQNAARQRKIVALHQGAGQWLHFLIPVGLIGLWGPSSSLAMFGYIIASIMILSSQLRFFKNRIVAPAGKTTERAPQDIVNQYAKQIFTYAWPFAAWGLFAWAQFASSRWALLSFSDAKEVGFYSVLYQFGYYPMIVVSALTLQSAAPVLFGRAGAGDDSARVADTVRLNNFLILAAGIATIILVSFFYLFHNAIFSLVVAPEYRPVSPLLPLLAMSGGLLAVAQMMNIRFFIKAGTQALIYPKITTALVGILLNYLGAYFYGLTGVVIAGIACSFIYLAWICAMYLLSKKNAES